jgi:hypothetical protein
MCVRVIRFNLITRVRVRVIRFNFITRVRVRVRLRIIRINFITRVRYRFWVRVRVIRFNFITFALSDDSRRSSNDWDISDTVVDILGLELGLGFGLS